MPANIQGQSVSTEQIHAFRMQRHHLLDQRISDPVRVCADICGAQAQLMSAAEIALWARVRKLKREAIHSALWETRSLVKTLVMRQTLHLIPGGAGVAAIASWWRSEVRVSSSLTLAVFWCVNLAYQLLVPPPWPRTIALALLGFAVLAAAVSLAGLAASLPRRSKLGTGAYAR